jgi:hypothetical protein
MEYVAANVARAPSPAKSNQDYNRAIPRVLSKATIEPQQYNN